MPDIVENNEVKFACIRTLRMIMGCELTLISLVAPEFPHDPFMVAILGTKGCLV